MDRILCHRSGFVGHLYLLPCHTTQLIRVPSPYTSAKPDYHLVLLGNYLQFQPQGIGSGLIYSHDNLEREENSSHAEK